MNILRRLTMLVACGASVLVTFLVSAPSSAQSAERGAVMTTVARTNPVPPQDDPFYTPPAGWSRTAPGTILRSRSVTLAFVSALPKRTKAWQLLYRTTDHNGRPMTTVTTALVAPGGSQPRSLVSYQVPTDAVAPHCAPSYILRQGSGSAAVLNQIELPLILAALTAGNVVVLPDYQGPRGEWGAPRQPGFAVLDGLRAARSFPTLGLPGRRTPSVLWGYSGGSLASGWAAQVQPSYAPDIDLRGVAVGGFSTDPLEIMKKNNGGPWAGLLVSVTPGILRASPALAAQFRRYLTPRGDAVLAHSLTLCDTGNLARYAFTNFDDLLSIPWRDFIALPEVIDGFRELKLGGGAPRAPLFAYHSATDEVVPVEGADATLARYCDGGTPVTYDRYLLGEHVSLAVTAAPTALAWMADRLNGIPAPRGCTTNRHVAVALTPAQVTGLQPLLGGLLAALVG